MTAKLDLVGGWPGREMGGWILCIQCEVARLQQTNFKLGMAEPFAGTFYQH
jgi:hypothetical protein